MPKEIARVLYNKKATVSADGSLMYYSLDYQQAYRAKSIGAFTESLHKFVNASQVLDKALKQDVRILDICFGLGYNCAVTFELASRLNTKRIHIVSVEKDPSLHSLVINTPILWPLAGYNILRNCLLKSSDGSFSMESYCMDATELVKHLSGTFDAIYFDPFSYAKNPEMWSVEMFCHMKRLLAEDGTLVTYACGKTARNNMAAAGLSLCPISETEGAFQPGTKAVRA